MHNMQICSTARRSQVSILDKVHKILIFNNGTLTEFTQVYLCEFYYLILFISFTYFPKIYYYTFKYTCVNSVSAIIQYQCFVNIILTTYFLRSASGATLLHLSILCILFCSHSIKDNQKHLLDLKEKP